jgi:hypothetical protein
VINVRSQRRWLPVRPVRPSSPHCKKSCPAGFSPNWTCCSCWRLEPTGNTRRILVASCRRHLLTRLSIADKPRWKQPSYARPTTPLPKGGLARLPSSYYFAAVAFPEMGPPFVRGQSKETHAQQKWCFGPRSVYPIGLLRLYSWTIRRPSFCPMVVRAKARRRDAPGWRGRIVALACHLRQTDTALGVKGPV